MAILAIGVIMGNSSAFADVTIAAQSEFWKDLLRIQSEVSFLVRNFFFVFMGLQFQPSILQWKILFGSMLLVLGIIIARYAVIRVIAYKDAEIKSYRTLLLLMIPKGLTASVMASVPLAIYGLKTKENIVWYAFIIIIITNIIASVGPRFMKNREQA